MKAGAGVGEVKVKNNLNDYNVLFIVNCVGQVSMGEKQQYKKLVAGGQFPLAAQ